MKIGQVEYGESIQLNDGHWKRFGIIIEMEDTDSSEKAWQCAVQEIDAARKKYAAEANLPLVIPTDPIPASDPKELIEAIVAIDATDCYEDALKILNESGFKYNKKLNDIVNSKPKKDQTNG